MPMLLNPSALSVSCLFLRMGRPCATCAVCAACVATLAIETNGLRLPWAKKKITNYESYSCHSVMDFRPTVISLQQTND